MKAVPNIGTTTFVYDIISGVDAGHTKETTTDPKSNVTERIYDKAGRLKEVIAGSDTTTYTYYDDGSRQSVVYESGAGEYYTYYDNGLLWTLTNEDDEEQEIDSYIYTYDNANNRTSVSYTYDSLNRLESVTEPSGKETEYTFDKAGNRLTETITIGEDSIATTYTYDERNRLLKTQTNTSNGDTSRTVFDYDDNGNMVSRSTEGTNTIDPEAVPSFALTKEGESTTTDISFYYYNVRNQLIQATEGDKTSVYTYNAEGYRIEKTVNGDTTRYLYEADKVILETDDENNQTARNIYGINLISRTVSSETLYYMYNGHADVTALITSTGTVTATYYYDAFGNIMEETGEADNPYRYSGYQYDTETDLYYLNARYYDSKIARFLSEDTYRGRANDPLSLNLYTYCANMPLKYWDPTGHWMAGDENLNDDAKAQIIALTNAYYAAETPEERQEIHKAADMIRADKNNYLQVDENGNLIPKDTLIEVDDNDEFYSLISGGLTRNAIDGSQGITAEEWYSAAKTVGAELYISSEKDYPFEDMYRITTNFTTNIGKAEINVEAKYVQLTKNTNQVAAGINVTTKTHYSAYYFYIPGWEDNMEDGKVSMVEYNGINEDDIGTASISNSYEFKNSWDMIGKTKNGGNVLAVVISSHGSPEVLSTETSILIWNIQIPSLDKKDINRLVITGCDTGHLDRQSSNIASSFAKMINGGVVVASDGTVGSSLYDGINHKTYSSEPEYPLGYHSANGSARDNVGWVIYQNIFGKVRVTKGFGKELTMPGMFSIMPHYDIDYWWRGFSNQA